MYTSLNAFLGLGHEWLEKLACFPLAYSASESRNNMFAYILCFNWNDILIVNKVKVYVQVKRDNEKDVINVVILFQVLFLRNHEVHHPNRPTMCCHYCKSDR